MVYNPSMPPVQSPTRRKPGRRPKLSPEREAELLANYAAMPDRDPKDVAAEFGVGRSTLFRLLAKRTLDQTSPPTSSG